MQTQTSVPAANAFPAFVSLPHRAGVGFKPEHADAFILRRAPVGFLEVHAENYMGAGGLPHEHLRRLREHYPISLHGVSLSIGGEGPLDAGHLHRLATLVRRYEPQSFSEHLAWSTHETTYFNDLLPVAYDAATLSRVANHIDEVQEHLGMPMLLENPSTYVAFGSSTWDEIDFIAEVSRRTGCGLLLDVNNVQVTCVNHGLDPFAYLDTFPVDAVGEIHLAGYAEDQDSTGARLLIDAHGSPVEADVWHLYRHLLNRSGPRPTLIEWDNDVPAADVLLEEAAKADAILGEQLQRRNRAA